MPLRPGFTSIAQLGAPGLKLEPGRGYDARRAVSYTLPADAFEGTGHWFVIHLNFEIRFRRVSAAVRTAVAGTTTEVAVDANGSTIASILFTSVLKNGTLQIRRSSFGLVAGSERSTGSALEQHVQFANYFTYRGVRSGTNRLVFRVATPIGGLVRDVRFLPGTGLAIQRQGPVGFRVTLQDSASSISVGDTMRVVAAAERTTGAPPATATLTVRSHGEGVRIDGPTSRTVAWGRGTPKTTFVLAGRRTGSWPVTVVATAGGITQQATTVVRVTNASSSRRWIGALVAVAIAAGVLATFILVRRR